VFKKNKKKFAYQKDVLVLANDTIRIVEALADAVVTLASQIDILDTERENLVTTINSLTERVKTLEYDANNKKIKDEDEDEETPNYLWKYLFDRDNKPTTNWFPETESTQSFLWSIFPQKAPKTGRTITCPNCEYEFDIK
jgi:hypothetical protein